MIIPAYQAEAFLAEALASVEAQRHQPFEVIVVDDASTDATAEVADRFPEVTCLRLPQNSGTAAARNAGLERARGELIVFLDADDILQPQAIEVLARTLLEGPCDCVLARQEIFVEPDVEMPPLLTPVDLTGKPAVHVSHLGVRRSAILAVGGYNPALRVSEDMDLLLRLERAGMSIRILDDVLFRRRLHGGNLSYESDLFLQGLLGIIRRQIHLERQQPEATGTA